ncbi:MAG: acylase [Chloroflexi bacterium]|nr:MAG: acylase [Chloroflexota bacterium]
MKHWKRWQWVLFWVLAVTGGTAVVLLAYAYWPATPNLNHLTNLGEQYNVQILRDQWGVPHVFGQTDADTAFGFGYAHAEDDFLTIQQTLAAARGMLAQIEGPDAAPVDYILHLLRVRELVAERYETDLSPEVRAVLQGYADGLNYYAALHPDKAFPGLYPVSGEDIVAGFVQRTPLFFGLDNTLTNLFKEERQEEISPRTAFFLPGKELNFSAAFSRYTWLAGNAASPIAYGSNAFAVSPARSANGETFLAINSHQPWEGPVAWYEAHLHSEEGWDTVGGTFPGAPLILVGHNRDVGWGFTVNRPDLIDVFVLEINPDNPNQYRFDGEWRDLEVREVPIRVKLLGRLTWTVKQEVLWSVYGPTVRQPHGTYAIRYGSMGDIRHVEAWFRLNKARNFEEWRAAMGMGAIPMFHAVYADKEGNIYYLYNGRIPRRSEHYNWQLYLPGNTSETLWTDYYSIDELPQVLNPTSGFVQSANSTPFIATFDPENPDPADFSPAMGIESRISNRSLRLLELFGADEAITAEDFYAYKYDMFYSTESAVPQWIAQLAAANLPDDPDLRQAVDMLQRWDLQTNPENSEAALFVLMMEAIDRNDLAHFSVDALTNTEIPTETLVAGLTEAVATLKSHFGRLDVPWSEVNRLRRGTVDLGVGGGPDILHAVYGRLEEDGRLRGVAGDSYVLLVTWDAQGNVHSQSIHQYGSATLVEDSPHYADQAALFVAREMKPVWMDEQVIRENLEQAYRPGEERP